MNIPPELLLVLRQQLNEHYTEKYGKGKRIRYSAFVSKWKADRKIRTRPPSDDTLQNFIQAKREGYSVRLIDGLCKILLNMSLEEWKQKHQQELSSNALASARGNHLASDTRMGLTRVYPQQTPQELLDRIASTQPKTAWFFGTHFGITLAQRRSVYLSMLKQGATVRFLVLNPSREYVRLQASVINVPEKNLHRECVQALNELITLMRLWRMESQQSDFRSKIEARFTTTLPSMRAYIGDPEDPNACSYFIPYINQVVQSQSPVLCCQNISGGISQRYFEGIQSVWDSAQLTKSINTLLKESPDIFEFDDEYSQEQFMKDYLS